VLRQPKNGTVEQLNLHTPADVASAGGVTWNYGNFLQACLNLIIIGLILFGLVKLYMSIARAFKLNKKAEAPVICTQPCPQCLEPVNVLAKRCRVCTSWFDAEAPMPPAFLAARDKEIARLGLPAPATAIQVHDDDNDDDDNDDDSIPGKKPFNPNKKR
jgi:hypothetical protein